MFSFFFEIITFVTEFGINPYKNINGGTVLNIY